MSPGRAGGPAGSPAAPTSALDADPVALRGAVFDALHQVYEEDKYLIEHRAHERSVVFHIGRRLAAAVAKWDAEWDVDVDYNRWQQSGLDQVAYKYMGTTDGRDAGPVYPDLIVHRRGEARPGHNLLVLEAKHGPVSDAARAVDLGKLRGYRDVFGYRHQVFVEFLQDEACPRWRWDGAIDRDGAAAEPGLPTWSGRR